MVLLHTLCKSEVFSLTYVADKRYKLKDTDMVFIDFNRVLSGIRTESFRQDHLIIGISLKLSVSLQSKFYVLNFLLNLTV